MKNKLIIYCLVFASLFSAGCTSPAGNDEKDPVEGSDGSIRIVLAREHQDLLLDEEAKREYESIREAFLETNLDYQADTINYVFIKGTYRENEQQMATACILVNKLNKPVNAIQGVLRLKFRSVDAEIAKATLDFDEDFMGTLNPDEGLLFYVNIPVRGLSADQEFTIEDIEGSFEEIRYTFASADSIVN